MFRKVSVLSALISAASAGTIVWDGRFNDMTSSADIAKWSFANPVGSYQYYIHGSGSIDKYVNLDSTFKNPADEGSKQGARITIDETSKWNGQTMLRTELIPQTSATINKGKLFYHFSIKTGTENAPLEANEHQIAFFESHFTELKFGGDAKGTLQWCVSGQPRWDIELKPDEWHNVAYEIDFDGGSVTFWHSLGSNVLTKTAGPITATTSSDGKDFHVGVLRLPGSNDPPGAEDWFFSGVYIESGDINTLVNSDGGPAPPPPASTSTLVTEVVPGLISTSDSTTTTTVPSTLPPAALVAAPTPSPAAAAAPQSDYGSGSGTGSSSDSDTTLPKEFTIKEFVAWLRARHA